MTTTFMLWQFDNTPDLMDNITAALEYYAGKYGHPVERVEIHGAVSLPTGLFLPPVKITHSPLVPTPRHCHIVPQSPVAEEQLSLFS